MALILVSLLLMSVASSWAQSTTTMMPVADLVSVLQAQGHFNTLLKLVTSAGLAYTLLSAPELTLFAPTDAAFARLPASTLQALEGNPDQLKSLLSYHAVSQAYKIPRHKSNDLVLASMDAGKPIRLNNYGNVHVIAAEGINVTTKNMKIQNGFVHELDGVMTPPEGNVVDLVEGSGAMSSLNTLLDTANLKDVIKSDENITVFAPNDAAFAKLDTKIVDYLKANPKDLTEVLLYHVVARKTLYSIGMKHSLTFPTADNHHDRIMTLEDGSNTFYVNDARIVETDISATNGVIHIIDKVLVPSRILLKLESQGIIVG